MKPYHPFERFFQARELRTMLLIPMALPRGGKVNITHKVSPITGDDRRVVEAELRWIGKTWVMSDYEVYWVVMG